MQKWDYLVVTIKPKAEDAKDVQRQLSEYGKEGWELVQITGPIAGLSGEKAIFKRRRD